MDELLQEMIAPAPSRSDLARRRRLVSTFVIIALAAIGVTSLTTSALFTDNESVTSGAITTGTVDLTTSGTPTFSVASPAGLAPGDAAFATVTVTNSGSLEYRYAVTYKATDTDTLPGTIPGGPPTGVTATTALLSSQLRLRAYVLASSVSCDRSATDGAPTIADVAPLATDNAMTSFIGTDTSGTKTGYRTLSAAKFETLCLRIDLPLGTGNEFQDTASTIKLQFDAEQTINNP